MDAITVFEGSDGELTKTYYAELSKRGPIGEVAMNLFRAQKCSERAKVYRGGIRGKGRYKDMAYDRKAWSMANLCDILKKHASELNIEHGWKQDPATLFGGQPSWVLYVDIPTGQCSFHSPTRGKGPDYSSDWDRVGGTRDRILNFCDRVFRCEPIEKMEPAAINPGTLPWGGMLEQKKADEVQQLSIFDDGRPPWE